MKRLIGRMQRLHMIESVLADHAQGLRVIEIAKEAGVSRRTIYRDLELLGDSGVPIWQDGSRYGIIRDRYLATIRLTFNEAVALYIAVRLLARHADEHNPHIVSALTKLATAFPDALANYVIRTADAIRRQPVNPTFVANLEVITACWAELHKVRFLYRSPRSGALRQRDLSPYTLEPSITGGLYVIGYDDWAQDIRTFKLDRLEHAQRLDATYSIPPDFDPRSHLADAWGIMAGPELTTVELRFSPAVAPLIQERVWHASQDTAILSDGSVRFRVRIAEPSEMRPWIRSWGAEVEVIEPYTLRQEMADEARRLAALYAVGASSSNT